MGLQVKHMIKCFVAKVENKHILICLVEFETDSQVIWLTRYIPATSGTTQWHTGTRNTYQGNVFGL